MFKNKNFLPLLIIIFFGILAGRSLIFERGYFNMHDDLQMMRQLELEKCFNDGQVPCRWVPDMGFGFGFPLFNFYPPLPYLFGQIFRILGFSFVETAKLTFASSFLLSGAAMYFLAKPFFGRIGGVLAAIFYIWAPYHSVDVYVRGAMNEAWALVFLPLIFLTSYKVIIAGKEEVKKWVLGFAISYTFLLLTHNLMVLIFTPFLGLWVLVHLLRTNKWKRILNLFMGGILGLGVSAFFTLPAIFENQFTQIKGQLVGYYDFTVHFATIRQLLFTRYWDYGPSVWLEEDRMSFQVGYHHWVLSILLGIFLLLRFLKGKGSFLDRFKNDRILSVGITMFFIGWMAAFMTHSRSTPLYLALPPLSYVQFPWRFLTLVIFAFSFMVGIIPAIFHSKSKLLDFAAAPLRITFSVLLILFVVASNWNYFKPEYGRMGPLTDEEKFEGRAWMLQQTAGIYDYLPSSAKEAPKEARLNLVDVVGGEAGVMNPEDGTYWGKFDVNVLSESSKLRVNIINFPGWRAFIDGRETEISIIPEEKWGRMYLDLPQGNHKVYIQFFNTPIRTWSNLITVLSLVVFSLLVLKKYKGKIDKI